MFCNLHGTDQLTYSAIRFRKTKDRIDFKFKNEFCIEGQGNYIQQMMLFKFQGRLYLVLARKTGLIQLYENTLAENNNRQRSFKLYKEWKHSNMNAQDSIVGIGFVNQQYLYSCSSEGKLVFRDLVNDDADESYRVYLIHKPISCIEIKMASDNKILAVCSGKNNELKIYEIETNVYEKADDFAKTLDHFFQIPLSGNDISLNYEPVDFGRPMLQLRRRTTSLNLRSSLNERQIHTLMPMWTSSLTREEYVYHTSPMDSISNWIVSIFVMPNDSGIIICGTQFGSIIVYDIDEDTTPSKAINLSQFSITTLKLFNNNKFLLWTDSISKAGVIKLSNFKTTNSYDHLKIGPMSSCKAIVNNASTSRKLNQESTLSYFDPIYLMCSVVDKRLVIYKLYDDNTYELIFNLQTDTLIPAMNLLAQNDSEYLLIDSLINGAEFDSTSHVTTPKRRSECLVPKSNPKLNVLVPINPTNHLEDSDNKICKSGSDTSNNIRNENDFDYNDKNDNDNENDNENNNENDNDNDKDNDTQYNNINEGYVGQVKSWIK